MNYLDKYFDKDPDIVYRKIESEVTLVPIRHNTGDIENLYILNEVGTFIWELIDGTKKLWEIKERVVEEFNVNEDEAEDDLITFVKHLVEIHCVSSLEFS